MLKNKALFGFALFIVSITSHSQTTDSIQKISHFSGSISITQNGISLVPTFSLGKPATIIMLSTGKGKLTFEPDLRFALAGKPWSMLFWWRYKVVQHEKFRFSVGAHPAINFRSMRLPVNGDSTNVIVARRFLAAEFVPNYIISENISVGIYYLVSRGFDISTPKHTHFLTLNTNVRNIKIGNQLVGQVIPQLYYLRQDGVDGVYFTSTFNLAKRNFPISVQSIINKEIESEIIGTKSFVWNFSVIYSFNKKYMEKQ